VQPGAGWTCENGGWLPPGTGTTSGGTSGGSTAGCSGSDPFAGIPGMFGNCISGNWIPNTAGGGGAPAPEPIALNQPAASAPSVEMPPSMATAQTFLE
jgi:hypothetical protein